MLRLIFALLFACFAVNCTARELPSYFPRCRIDDEKLNECILNATRILKPKIRDGVKEIKLPSFNPLVVSFFGVLQNMTNFLMNVNFTNFNVVGLDNYNFNEITYDPLNFVLDGKVRFERVSYQSTYSMRSWLFYFPVIGDGIAEGVFDWINGTFQIKGKLISRKGKEYYSPTSVKVKILTKGSSVYLTGLFDNNIELAHLINEIANQNYERIVNTSTPSLELLAEGFLMHFIKTMTRLIPYNKIFPHS